MHPRRRDAVLLSTCWILATCACIGPTPDILLQSTEEDRRLGQEVTQKVQGQIGLLSDPQRGVLIGKVGERLVQQLDERRFEFQFFILDQDEPNAFAAPGGYVFVSRGLLAMAESEDELANAIGHEIIHVTRRHTARQLAKQTVPNLFALPGRVVGRVNRDLGLLLNTPINTVGAAVISAHSRQDELEADRLGQRLCARGGYDPAALSPLLERMQRAEELRTGQARRAGFFDTHPTTPDRAQRLARQARGLELGPTAPLTSGRDEFLDQLDGLLVGANPAHGVFREQAFMHPDLRFFIEFPFGWLTVNTPMFVGGFAPEMNAVLFLGIDSEGQDARRPGQEFVETLRREQQVEPSEAKEVMIGDWPGYVVTLTDDSSSEPMNLHILWVASRGLIYKMIGLAPQSQRTTLRDAAMSFRPLTDAERASIRERRLRIARARSGEDLNALSQRSGNAWTIQTTAVTNGLAIEQPLQAGQLVKIAVWQDYNGR